MTRRPRLGSAAPRHVRWIVAVATSFVVTTVHAQDGAQDVAEPATVRASDVSDASLAIDRPRVSLSVDASCEALDVTLVRRVLDVELGSDAELEAPEDEATSRVRVRCDEGRVLLLLDEPLTNKHLERSLELAESAEVGRSRLVAIAIAELLAASWIELGMRHEAGATSTGSEEARAIALEVARERLVPETDEVEPPRPEPVPETGRPFGVRVFGVARVSGEPFHFAGGGGLAIDTQLALPLVLIVDVRAEQGSVDVTGLGGVRLSTMTAAAQLALRASFGLTHADFGVGLRGGAGLLEGRGSDGISAGSQLGGILGVVASTQVAFHIAYSAYFHLGIELGWIFLPVFGTIATTGEIVARIGGAQLAITAGFEVRPD